MRTKLFLVILLVTSFATAKDMEDKNDYLRKVLGNLEKIESARYHIINEGWNPGDTVPANTYQYKFQEYNNPNDTTIGASFIHFSEEDTTQVKFVYDGNIEMTIYHDKKGFIINDFTARPLPFRPLSSPFFNNAKNIIKYIFETKDHITMEWKDEGNNYYVKLTINEEQQVEFFGKAYHMPTPPFEIGDPTSIYELWISKSNDLPYKIRREQSHDISVRTCLNPEFNKLSIKDFKIYDYFPHGYEYRRYGVRESNPEASSLIGKKAPMWTLNDKDDHSVSLSDLKSKVLLINFTGIGCGACQSAIPFLKELSIKYPNGDFEHIAIDSWRATSHSLQNYVNRKQLNYKMLCGTEEVIKEYQTGGAAPVFFILDKDRVIRKVIRGYAIEKTDKEITDAISEILK